MSALDRALCTAAGCAVAYAIWWLWSWVYPGTLP